MFTIVTGTPGAGKTLYVIDRFRKITERPVYYCNLDGLSDSLGWHKIEVEDIKRYHELIPQGAIFIVDEVQKFFPVRSPSASVPAAISHLETHRHEGQDVVFITQHPSLIDHHARRLVGEHVHLQRNFGMPFATLYRGNELLDPKNWHELQKAEKSQFKHPKDVFPLYKSAEVHTHKARLPKKLLLIPLLLAFIAFGCYKFYKTLFGKAPEPAVTAHVSPGTTAIAAASSASAPGTVTTAPTAEQLAVSLKPVIEGVPWSAPIYKDLAKPVVLPVISGCLYSKSRDKCSCYTQQATVIDMSQTVCKQYLAHHSFNPFKAEKQQEQQAGYSHDYQPRDIYQCLADNTDTRGR
ncbi:MAG: zonular occludens toxin domain-containing protein [Mucilaginibacter sp.]